MQAALSKIWTLVAKSIFYIDIYIWLVVLFYHISTLFRSFNAELNFKQLV